MVVRVDYELTGLSKFPKIVRDIRERGGDLRKPMKRFGIYMLQETLRGFDTGGRFPLKWKPLSDATLKMKERRGRGNPAKILLDSGALRKSITTKTVIVRDGAVQSVYTNIKYAPIHQLGGPSKFFGHSVNIPQRKFLFFSERDKKRALRLVKDHSKEMVRMGGAI